MRANFLFSSLLLALALLASPGGESFAAPGSHFDSEQLYKTRLSNLARSDLAKRLGLPEREIQVVNVTATVWPDTALGCPQPGQIYAQVLTKGYRIVLAAGGKRYEYHSDTKRVVLCG